MSDKPAKPAGKLAGVTSFGGDDDGDYIAPPAREVRDQAKAVAAALGFVSDKPAPLPSPAPDPAPAPTARKRTRQPSRYPDHYNLRLRDGDRERFDDYAYRHRLPKGEVFRIMLDLLEADERAREE